MNHNPRVVLVPGIWDRIQTMNKLGGVLESQGCQVSYFSYDNSGATSIQESAALLADFLTQLEKPPVPCDGGLPHVVGFSMGGLVVRAALTLHRAPVRSAVFLHSPHHGSLNAWLLPHLPAVREMIPGSEFLRRLQVQKLKCPTLAMWCPGDLMVVPGRSALMEAATRTVCCRVPAHVWPLVSQRLQRLVYRFIRRCEAMPLRD